MISKIELEQNFHSIILNIHVTAIVKILNIYLSLTSCLQSARFTFQKNKCLCRDSNQHPFKPIHRKHELTHKTTVSRPICSCFRFKQILPNIISTQIDDFAQKFANRRYLAKTAKKTIFKKLFVSLNCFLGGCIDSCRGVDS